MVTALVLGGVFLLGMVIVTGYAAWALPAGARVPLNAGVVEYSVWLSKFAGLAAWLGIGVLAFAVFAALTLDGLFSAGAESVEVVVLPCVMVVVLAGEVGAFNVARWTAADAAAKTPAAPTAAGTPAPPTAAETEAEFAGAASAATESGAASADPQTTGEPAGAGDSRAADAAAASSPDGVAIEQS